MFPPPPPPQKNVRSLLTLPTIVQLACDVTGGTELVLQFAHLTVEYMHNIGNCLFLSWFL